jgi:hypothetical protein
MVVERISSFANRSTTGEFVLCIVYARLPDGSWAKLFLGGEGVQISPHPFSNQSNSSPSNKGPTRSSTNWW